jgi:hypothetical protein
VNERLTEAERDMGRAILRLRLEGEEDLVVRYKEIRSLWWEYTYLLTSEEHKKYGKISETRRSWGLRWKRYWRGREERLRTSPSRCSSTDWS